MTDRHDDLEPGIRDALDEMAGEATPAGTAPPSVLRAARRRVARNLAAVAVAVSVLTAGSVAVVQVAARGGGHRQVGSETPGPTGTTGGATTGPSPTAAPPDGGTGTGPMPLMTFLDGIVYRYADSGDGLVAEPLGRVPDSSAVQPPVATPSGIVVLGARPGHVNDLWLLDNQGAPHLLASNVDGFAVSADGGRLAYAKVANDSTTSELVEAALPSGGILHSTTVDTSARAVGYAGDLVLLGTGDGAAAQAAVWPPDTTSIKTLTGFGRALASDPSSGVSVLTQGDGVCWSIVWLGTTPQDRNPGPKQGNGCGISGVSIEPGGATVAGVILTSEARTGQQRFVMQDTGSDLGSTMTLDGAFQTWWYGSQEGAPTVFVMAQTASRTYAVYLCRVSAESTCPSGPVWTGAAPDREGSAWLVEVRPQPPA
jgi:hypothetical protein